MKGGLGGGRRSATPARLARASCLCSNRYKQVQSAPPTEWVVPSHRELCSNISSTAAHPQWIPPHQFCRPGRAQGAVIYYVQLLSGLCACTALVQRPPHARVVRYNLDVHKPYYCRRVVEKEHASCTHTITTPLPGFCQCTPL